MYEHCNRRGVDGRRDRGDRRADQTRESERIHALLGREPLAVGDLIVAAVLQGSGADRDFDTGLRLLATCELVVISRHDVAVAAARNHRTLRVAGVTMRKIIDTLIATRCILDKIPLLYSGRDSIRSWIGWGWLRGL